MNRDTQSQPRRLLLRYALVTSLWLVASLYVAHYFSQKSSVGLILESLAGTIMITSLFVVFHYHWLRRQETTQDALQESQRTFGTLMSNLPGMVYRCQNDADWTMEFISEGSLPLTGYPPEQLLAGQPASFTDLIHPDDRHIIRSSISQSLRDGGPFELIYRIKTAGGAEKWVWEQGQPVPFGDRIVLEGFITDITPQRQANEALRQSEARYRLLAENAQDIIYRLSIGPDGRFEYISPAVLAVTGYTPEEAYAFDEAPEPLIHPDDHPLIDHFLHNPITQPVRLRLQHKDGHAIWVEVRNTPIFDDQGQFVAVEGIARDVSATREIEAALRESETHLRSIFDGAAIGIMRIDLEGRLLQSNTALQSMLQYSAEELYLRPLTDLLPDNIMDQWRQLFVPLVKGDQEASSIEKPYRRKDGHTIWCRSTRSLVRDAQGQPAFIIAMLEDITEQRLAEQALARRTEEISQLYELSKQLGQILQLDELYDQVSQTVQRLMDCDNLVLSAYTPDDNLIRCIYMQHEGVVLDPSDLPPIPLEPEGTGTQSVAIRTGEALILNDYQAHLLTASTRYYANQHGVIGPDEVPDDEDVPRSALIVPLKHEGQVTGVVQVMSYRKDAYSEADFNVLNALAPQVAIALQNATLYQQAQAEIAERKRAQEAEYAQRTIAEALRDSAAALNESLDLDEVLDRILSNVGEVVRHDAAYILLIEEDSVRMVRSWGFAEHGAGNQVHTLETSLTDLPDFSTMIETLEPAVISDTRHNERWIALPATEWVRSYAGAPLVRNQSVIGFLGVLSTDPGFFSEAHGDYLRAFAGQAAIAMDNARLYDEINLHAKGLEQRVQVRTEQLQNAKERLEAILDNATEIIMLLRPDGTIEQANRMLSETFGIEEHACLGKSLGCIVSPAQAEKLADALHAVTTQMAPQRLEMVIENQHVTFEAEFTLSPIVKSGGRITGVVCNVHDITSHKEIERQLRQTIDSANQLNDMKSRFVSTVSHEFRTPLAVIQTALDLLGRYEDRLSAEQKVKEYSRIRTAIRNMVALLDNVLVFSRGEDGRVPVKPELIDLEAFCRDLIEELKHSSGETHHFVLDASGDCTTVAVDPRLVRHIVLNLLSNAVKYSSPGSTISIDLRCGRKDALISLTDQGIGIPPDDQKHLFEPFHRAGNAIEIKGTGLGLAIVKQSVDLHGGIIRCESTEGVGTTFHIRLPYLLDNLLNEANRIGKAY
ncbi:PAS domain S-box protein [Aggregatilinea lenta]|uniref:PAS domain S-box protein n=1 Tax=Aggregatilinea lenta TaxID=913108 RepID=UPI000E5A32B8|nr:PAS domain S-box protein [Aggregatilinea lenta]